MTKRTILPIELNNKVQTRNNESTKAQKTQTTGTSVTNLNNIRDSKESIIKQLKQANLEDGTSTKNPSVRTSQRNANSQGAASVSCSRSNLGSKATID